MARRASDYVKTIRQLETKVKELEEQHFKDEKKLTEAKSVARSSLLKSQDADLKVQDVSEENAGLVATMVELRARIACLESNNSNLRENYAKHDSELQQKMSKLQRKVQNLKTQLESSETAYQALQNSAGIVEQQFESYDGLIVLFREKERVLCEQIFELTKQIKQLEDETESLKKFCREKEVELAQIKETISSLESQMEMLELAKPEPAEEVDRSDWSLVKSKIRSLATSLKKTCEDVRQLRQKFADRLTAAEEAEELNAVLKQRNADLQANNEFLANKVNDLLESQRCQNEFSQKQIVAFKHRISRIEGYTELLQNMLSENCKKKPLWTRCFGVKKKPAKSVVLSYSEIRDLLVEERGQNIKLKEQVRALGGEPLWSIAESDLISADSKKATDLFSACVSATRPTCTTTSSSNILTTVAVVHAPPRSAQCSRPLPSTSTSTPGDTTEEAAGDSA